MKPLTVKQLAQACVREINNGNGDKVIMISSDDEGNNYHYLWYTFTTIEEMEEPIKIGGKVYKHEFEYVNENVEKKENTIILG